MEFTDPIEDLKAWFAKLPISAQRDVLRFIYGDYMITAPFKEGGRYHGPVPGMIKQGGLYCGPAPTAEDVIRNIRVCSACGRPL